VDKVTTKRGHARSEVSVPRRLAFSRVERVSATYKLAIPSLRLRASLAHLKAVTDKGQVGQILSRSVLAALGRKVVLPAHILASLGSLISEWRKQRDRGALAAFARRDAVQSASEGSVVPRSML